MLYKTIVPDSVQLGLNPVLILKVSSKGLDKTASMQKRAAAFSDVIADIKPSDNKAYLHVITTGAYLYFGAQRNGDSFNLDYLTIHPPLAKTASAKVIQLDGGLKKYHDISYSSGKAKVYQLHQTLKLGSESSGIVKCARYNNDMHRGLLLILVDADKWALRLHKRASGLDIYLSIGCTLDHDVCSVCGNIAHTLKLHCDHVNMHKLAVYLDGTRCCMFNDAPSFYDISGVNVPADPIAFVLRKVASGMPAQHAVNAARYMVGTRPPMVINKAASILNKLSKILKLLECKVADDPIFCDDLKLVLRFLTAVLNYPADLIISNCNRKAILLSPKMLFKIIGKLTDLRLLFNIFADSCPCCGKKLMLDMTNDALFAELLKDGSFDTITPVDLNLANILLDFIPLFGVNRPALNGKSIRISIRIGTPTQADKSLRNIIDAMPLNELTLTSNDKLSLKSLLTVLKKAQLVNDLFRRAYARYVLSFAQQNSLDTCRLALQKIARYK